MDYIEDEAEKKRALERMRNDLRYAEQYRERARGVSHMAELLSAETPAYKSEVTVKGNRWWRRERTSPNSHSYEEIVLTDTERRELRNWLREKAQEYAVRGDEIELKYAGGANA